MPHAGVAGQCSQPQAGQMVHLVGWLGEPVAHRIVGNRRQMHHRIAAGQQAGIDVARVAEDLAIEQGFGQHVAGREAMCEQPGIVADQHGIGEPRAQVAHQDGADIAHVAGDQDLHGTTKVGGVSLPAGFIISR